MNAKMRIGHFTHKQRSRLRVKMATLKTALVWGLLALSVSQTLAEGQANYDTNLERWAKESIAKRLGDIRETNNANEPLRMVTELDVKHGPLPLGVERQTDPINFLANLYIGSEAEKSAPKAKIEPTITSTPFPQRKGYLGAMVFADN